MMLYQWCWGWPNQESVAGPGMTHLIHSSSSSMALLAWIPGEPILWLRSKLKNNLGATPFTIHSFICSPLMSPALYQFTLASWIQVPGVVSVLAEQDLIHSFHGMLFSMSPHNRTILLWAWWGKGIYIPDLFQTKTNYIKELQRGSRMWSLCWKEAAMTMEILLQALAALKETSPLLHYQLLFFCITFEGWNWPGCKSIVCFHVSLSREWREEKESHDFLSNVFW